MIDLFIIGGISFIMAIFVTKMRDAWYEAYYNEDGNKKVFDEGH